MPHLDKDVKYFSEICGFKYIPGFDFKENNIIYKFRGNLFKKDDLISIIKISRSDNPFWGISAMIVDDFTLMKTIKFSAIFLTSKTTGYYYTLSNLNLLIKERNLKKVSTDYKINSPLNSCFYFTGIENFKNFI